MRLGGIIKIAFVPSDSWGIAGRNQQENQMRIGETATRANEILALVPSFQHTSSAQFKHESWGFALLYLQGQELLGTV